MPDYLLDYEFWQQELCNDAALYGSAYGLLVSYAWLVRHESDLRIAIGAGLLPVDIHWNDWVVFVADLNIRLDSITLYEVNHRYRYGELRLSRLNSLYHLGLAGLSLHNTAYGFMSGSVRYTTFFERNFGWMLAVFVYVTVILSAMQVALATNKFGSNGPFQQFSYGLALLSIAFVFAVVIFIYVACVVVAFLVSSAVYHTVLQEGSFATEAEQSHGVS